MKVIEVDQKPSRITHQAVNTLMDAVDNFANDTGMPVAIFVAYPVDGGQNTGFSTFVSNMTMRSVKFACAQIKKNGRDYVRATKTLDSNEHGTNG